MATCDPKLLPGQATCFRCAEPGTLKQIQLYLLGVLSGVTSPVALSAGSATFRPFRGKFALAAEVYLLAVITGQSTTPSVLEKAAACWFCIPNSERLNIETYLLASSAGISTDPKVLSKSIAPYRPLLPIFEQVRLYALNVIAGNLSAKAIAAGATCLMCLDHGHLEEIFLYLLCQGMTLIPAGSIYNGQPPEFDLTVLPNRSYVVTWGSNELSMTLCGVVYNSAGAGQSTGVWTGNCTVMQFFGAFAGTTVTAKVLIYAAPPPPTNLNFSLNAAGTNVIYTWDAPTDPSIQSTEVWISTDGTTYTLDSTVAAPTATYTHAAPGAAAKLYVKLRWLGTFSLGKSGFNLALLFYGAVSDWQQRIITNGGAAPATSTIRPVNTFYGSIDAAGTVIGKIKALNVVPPDSMIAVSTPLIKTFGNDPWTLNGGAGTFDLTVNGVRATAVNSCLFTGCIPSTCFASTSTGGLSCYVHTTHNNDAGADTDMGSLNGAGQSCLLYTNFNSAFSAGQIYNNTTGSVTSLTIGVGFWCTNVTGAAAASLYNGTSGSGFALVGSIATGGGTRPTFGIYAMGQNNSGVTAGTSTVRRFSFFAVHDGFTAAEAQVLYNAVQALRVAFGGGFS